jgi:Flp pilus assembly protein TadG
VNPPLLPHPSEHGAVAIEFALSVIILVTLVFGCIGVAMGFYTYEVVNEYARDASRYAIVHGNGCIIKSGANASNSCAIGSGTTPTANAALKTYLNNQIYPGINGNNLTVITTYAPGPGATICNVAACNGAGDQVTVQVTYPYLYNIPFIPQNSFTMNGSSTMVISQ